MRTSVDRPKIGTPLGTPYNSIPNLEVIHVLLHKLEQSMIRMMKPEAAQNSLGGPQRYEVCGFMKLAAMAVELVKPGRVGIQINQVEDFLDLRQARILTV